MSVLYRTKQFAVRKILPNLSSAVLHNPYVTGKIIPLGRHRGPAILLQEDAVTLAPPPDGLPVPPKELWENYGKTPEEYLATGRQDINTMIKILGAANVQISDLLRVLDVGCASGRMLRHFPRIQGQSEIWGVDVNAEYIMWCQKHLSPPMLFATTTTAPHLPFEDNYFDLIYCGSLFTHISDLADAWFLELRRVLRKGGYAFITIHDQRQIDAMRSQGYSPKLRKDFDEFDKKFSVTSKRYAWFSFGADPYSQVFYDTDYLVRKWSQFSKVLSITKEAYWYQTALLVQK
jgi:ubiquinone/menaquinone biosynthesis C-methylase UbiE